MQATVFYILTVVDAVFEKTTLLPTLQLLLTSVHISCNDRWEVFRSVLLTIVI